MGFFFLEHDFFFRAKQKSKYRPSPLKKMVGHLTLKKITQWIPGGRHRRARMVVGFTTTYAISAYHH
jgi:hypothetical protein